MTPRQGGIQPRYFAAERPSRFGPFLLLSLVLHAAAMGGVIWQQRHASEPPSLRQQAILVQQIAWAPKERPKNWLPRLPAQPDDRVKPESVKVSTNDKAVAPPKEKLHEDPQADDKADRDRKKRMARALDRIEKRLEDIDGSPKGTPGVLTQRGMEVLGSVYAGQLRELFQENWSVPGIISKDELKRLSCAILLKIDARGTITGFSLKQTSGNRLYDSSVLKAVKLTTHVPLPDPMLRDLVMTQGILINFFWKE